MRRIARFLHLPRSNGRIRADIDDEIGFDIDMRARDLTEQGMDAADAHARATREFGDLEATRCFLEETDMQIEADARRRNTFEDLRADLAIALRGMRRTPLFASVVLLTLALGIGVNTAVFSVVRRVLIAPLPFRAPEQLYRLYTAPAATDGDNDKLSYVELKALSDESKSVAGVTLFGNYQGVTYSDDRIADAWQAASVAPNFFATLGVQPALGRAFRSEDFQTGAPSVAIISYEIWQRVFGGDRGVVNRAVEINAKMLTIIGVMPESFVGPTFTVDMVLPLNVDAIAKLPRYASSRVWRAVARLKPGVSLEQWNAELATLRPRIHAAHPEVKNGGVILPTPLHEAIVGGAGPVLWLVMGGALIVLLATCVNIAGLFLSRAASRQRELGIRTALGAARGRLIRAVLAETLLYGMVGGAIGVMLSIVLKAALLHNIGPMLPKLGDVRIDAGVLLFALGTSVAAGIIFGVLPALAATRVDVRDALGDSGARAASRGAKSVRVSHVLVSAQLAFALVLVVGANLLVRTVKTLLDTDLGYQMTDHQATFYLSPGTRYRDPAAQRAFIETFIERVHAMPGVAAVGYTVTPPWNGSWISSPLQIEGRPQDGGDRPSAVVSTASPEYFKALGMQLHAGRAFNAGDVEGAPAVVVVSESMAKRFWPNVNPIGTRMRLTGFYATAASDTLVPREIVGVIGDAREDALSAASPTVYLPAEQASTRGGGFVVRSNGAASVLLPLIKDAVRTLDAKVPVILPRTLGEVRSNSMRRQNVAMALTGLFAVLALLLACLGVYGVMAYSVLARTREFGIRSALGASRAAVLRLVLRDVATTTGIGLIAGLVLAMALSRFAASLLVGATARDPLSYVVAMLILGVAALGASAIPARAATRIDPVEALRLE